jgi:hypothetical protein
MIIVEAKKPIPSTLSSSNCPVTKLNLEPSFQTFAPGYLAWLFLLHFLAPENTTTAVTIVYNRLIRMQEETVLI